MSLKKRQFCFVTTIALLFFSVFYSSQATSAEEPNYEIQQSETFETSTSESISLISTDANLMINNNEEQSNLLINDKGYSAIDFGHIEQITEFTVGEDTYLLVEKRYSGSGSILSYEVFHVVNGNVTSIHEAEDIPRGIVSIDDESNELTEASPIVGEDDSLAEPSKVQVQQFEVSPESLVSTQIEEMSIDVYKQKFSEEESQFHMFSTKSSNPNPSDSEINRMLTETALEYNIPPEVFKAIAWQESRWRQFDSNGDPLIGFDGRGLGIMQITYSKEFIEDNPDIEHKLKHDIEYNIEIGAKILIDKWNWTGNLIPTVNDGSWEIVDNWYFAITAYNGLGRINDPNYNTNASYPPFQNHIYNHMRNYGLLNIHEIPKGELDITHSSSGVMQFRDNKMQYDTPNPHTKTKHLLGSGDTVYTNTSTTLTLRDAPGGDRVTSIPNGSKLTVTGDHKYQNNNSNHFVWVPVDYNGQTGYVASSYLVEGSNTDRLYGQTRYETAAMISQEGWSQSDTVVLVRGDDFPDALAGAPLAYDLDAPMLVTRTDSLRKETKSEIQRLGAKNVVILGGHLAIDESVEKELDEMGLNVDRIDGPTRFDTARMIADRLGGNHQEAIVINVDAFADAMAIAPYAARNGVPILLTKRDSIPSQTKQLLDGTSKQIVLGGDLVISDSILNKMSNPEQLAGHTRYDTTDMIIKQFNEGRSHAYVVSGNDFVDGLTASVLAAKRDESIILTGKNTLPGVAKNSMNDFSRVTVVGGPIAISEDVVSQIRNR